MRASFLILFVALAAASAQADVGEYAVFVPSRDWSNAAGDGNNVNLGQAQSLYAYRQQWSECCLADWDTEEVLAWMTAHPLVPGQWCSFSWHLCTPGWWLAGWPDGVEPGLARFEVRTLNMPVDWAEGDGVPWPGAGSAPGAEIGWNFSPFTPAAVNIYAQGVWYLENFVAAWKLEECVPWTTYDGTVVETFQNSPELFRNVNGLVGPEDDPIYLYVDASEEPAAGTWFSVELDYRPDHPAGEQPAPLVNDLLFNENNRGLVLGPGEVWDAQGQQWIPWETGYGKFYSKDCQDSELRPYLRVDVWPPPPPRPGDANTDGWVDGADYTVWADNYLSTPVPPWLAGGWMVGNFTADDVVDGADYTVWADNYSPPPPGGAAPEPGALVLLAGGGAAALIRRRR